MTKMRKQKSNWEFQHEYLKTLREMYGLSPEDVGKRIGRPGMTIRNWEKGGFPKINDLIVIANEFEIDPRAFFTKIETKEPEAVGV